MYIDGDIFVAADGTLKRFVGGQSGGWAVDNPGDELLRPAPDYIDLTAPGDRGAGLQYAYDKANARLVANDKASAEVREQYRVTISPGWRELRGMFVTPGTEDDPATLTWMDSKRLYTSVLQPVATPAATGSPPARSPAASTRATARRGPQDGSLAPFRTRRPALAAEHGENLRPRDRARRAARSRTR